MSAFTIVTTTASQGADSAEVSLLADEFGSEAEAVGYARRMAEELVGMANQLALDFDYSNVTIYEGDRIEEDLDTSNPAFVGLWVLDEEGAAYLTATEFRESDAEEGLH